MQYENAELYDNVHSPKLTSRYPPPKTSASGSSASHYKVPVSKISSKFLTADAKSKVPTKVLTLPLTFSRVFQKFSCTK